MSRYRKAITAGVVGLIQYFVFRETPIPPEIEGLIGTIVLLVSVYVVPNEPEV